MPSLESQHIDALLEWLRHYFAACAIVYLVVATIGGWYATHRRDRWRWILAAMGLLYFVSLPFHWQFTNDDSYIFYRYAENIASGVGPVYNSGIRCEGFTSPAWTFLLASGHALGASTLWFSKILGAAFGAISLLMMILTVRRISEDTRVIFLVSLFVTTSQVFVAWIPSGMDTALFVAWLSVWSYTLVRNPHGLMAPTLLSAVGVWIRPEAYFISLIGFGWIVYSHYAKIKRWHRLAFIGIAAVVMVLPFIWRYLTFGELLPTTFYAKSDRSLRSGFGFLFGAVNGHGPIAWALTLFGLWKLRHTSEWAGISVAAIAVYVVWAGGDVLVQRFSLWWLPFIAVGLSVGLQQLANSRHLDLRMLVTILALLLVSQELHRMYGVTRPGSENDGYSYVSSNSVHTTEADAPIGRYLLAHGLPTDTVFTDNIGAIGYYSGMFVTDALGLVDQEVATLIHEGRKDSIATLLIARRPKWIVGYEGQYAAGLQVTNIGSLPVVLIEKYDRMGQWRSRTGYSRLLWKRRADAFEINAAPQN